MRYAGYKYGERCQAGYLYIYLSWNYSDFDDIINIFVTREIIQMFEKGDNSLSFMKLYKITQCNNYF